VPHPALEERRPAITPQLAVRVAVLGGIAFVVFAIVFFRLWFLQVLSGEDYVSQARENRVRKIKIEAPRGDIVDRNGITLVRTREAPVVQILPNRLPEAERDLAAAYGKQVSAAERRRLAARDRLRTLDRSRRQERRRLTRSERRERTVLARAARRADRVPVPPMPADPKLRLLYRRLGRVIQMRPVRIHQRVVQQLAQTPYAAVTVKTAVPRAAFNYLKERADRFPGVRADKLYLRSYPHKTLGAQLFGTLREISPTELKKRKYRGVTQGTRIGKDGVEETYDRFLRGRDGYYSQVVNALNEADDKRPVTRREPIQGYQLRLTLDLELERAAEKSLAQAIAAARSNANPADSGAYVAMNPDNGEVYALGSYPSFDANVFAKPLSNERFAELNSEENGAPLFNRATAANSPTGSTFKLITAIASLQEGLIAPETQVDDPGFFKLGPQTFTNARRTAHGSVNMIRALQVSSDVYFYKLGAQANGQGPIIQRWARRLSLDRKTGIDIPGEFGGVVPDAKWNERMYAEYLRCIKRRGLGAGTVASLVCGGVQDTWTAGDNVQLAIGQGYLQATPLQMAVAYSALANGGRVVRPHLGQRVEDGAGRLIQEIDKTSRRRIDLSPTTRATIEEGLRKAAMEPGGTSAAVFEGFPRTVYGKTGTVQRPGQPDHAWYVAYVKDPKRPIVVAVTVEKGGFGAETAAPAACRILAQWYGVDAECKAAQVPD